jgi:hypothetical protein
VVGGGTVVAGGTVVTGGTVVAGVVGVVVPDVDVSVAPAVAVCVAVTVVESVDAGGGASVEGGLGGTSVVGEAVSATGSVFDGSTAPKLPRTWVAVAGVVGTVDDVFVAAVDGDAVAVAPCVAAASKPGGSVPTFDAIGVGVAAVDAGFAGACAASAGPY